MIIFRYLVKEVVTTLVALTAILLFIFLSNQGIQYLNRAATGHLPGIFVIKLLLLEIPNLLGLLLPLGFYMALMLAYGRLYAESEMTALAAGGYGTNQLLKDSLYMACAVAGVVGILVCWGGAWIAKERAYLLRATGLQTLIQTVMPGRFQSLQDGHVVFYIESMTTHPHMGHHFFLARRHIVEGSTQWQVLWSEKTHAIKDKKSREDYLMLDNGRAYVGVPGLANFKLMEFKTYQIRLPHLADTSSEDIRTRSMSDLLAHFRTDKNTAAELQWRLSIPLMVVMLTLVAVPLSRVAPRAGKYAHIFPALLIFTLYANLMFVGRSWITSGLFPMWVTPLLLHGGMGVLAWVLWKRSQRVMA
ncbi:MAG: LPS export ABC transporter permease LptF [Gammaproteobacteria bacterium]|nr:LPS export ABC transporter permease LptF [Gammaproteobacteria bacterium]